MAQQITLEVEDVTLFATALNNAVLAYNDIVFGITYECQVSSKFLPLKNLSEEQLFSRLQCLKNVYNQVIKIEQELKDKED